MYKNESLLLRARRLEEHALAEIYDHLSPSLYRYAMRLLGDAELAEECVADTFSRFLHALYRGGGPRQHLQAYLYRVAHNWVTDHYRRQRPIALPLNPGWPMDHDSEPGQTVEEDMELEHLRAALAHLTPDQRQVIILRFIEGWTNKEVALAVKKSVVAVKALQHRGLVALRRLLVKEDLA
jgi:RNA polymerase sigma-70 factor (ECF subfamily)